MSYIVWVYTIDKTPYVVTLQLIIIIMTINNNRRLVTLAEHTSDHGKQTNNQAQKNRGSMARKLLGANAKSYRLKLKLSRLVSTSTDCPPASTGWQPPSTALGPAPASASLGGGPAVAGALESVEVVHGPIHPRVVGAAYRPWAPRDGVCMQQLVDDGGLRLAVCVPQPSDPVAAE